MVTAFCVREKIKVEMKDPVETTTKNGRTALSGVCPNCGTKVFRITGVSKKSESPSGISSSV